REKREPCGEGPELAEIVDEEGGEDCPEQRSDGPPSPLAQRRGQPRESADGEVEAGQVRRDDDEPQSAGTRSTSEPPVEAAEPGHRRYQKAGNDPDRALAAVDLPARNV